MIEGDRERRGGKEPEKRRGREEERSRRRTEEERSLRRRGEEEMREVAGGERRDKPNKIVNKAGTMPMIRMKKKVILWLRATVNKNFEVSQIE